MINRGARLNATDNQGHSPLKWARETGSRDVFTYLKSQGGKEFDSSTTQRTNKKQRHSLTKSSSAPPLTTPKPTSVQDNDTNDQTTNPN